MCSDLDLQPMTVMSALLRTEDEVSALTFFVLHRKLLMLCVLYVYHVLSLILACVLEMDGYAMRYPDLAGFPLSSKICL